jgi:hypothetical protein
LENLGSANIALHHLDTLQEGQFGNMLGFPALLSELGKRAESKNIIYLL